MKKRFVIGLAGLVGLYLLGSTDQKARPPPSSSTTTSYLLPQEHSQPHVGSVPVKLEASSPAIVDKPVRSREAAQSKLAFTAGNAVALRNGPGKNYPVLDRFDTGRKVEVFGSDGEWSRVKDGLTQREGWVFSSLLSETPPEPPRKVREARAEKPVPTIAPELSDSVVVQRLIAASIANYPGSCPCPENRDRAGSRCGKRSAWAKGGGYAPLCYASDITPAMISAFRSR